MLEEPAILIVVARATDVGVQDRRSVRGALARRTLVRSSSRMDLTEPRSARRCRWRVPRRLPDARCMGPASWTMPRQRESPRRMWSRSRISPHRAAVAGPIRRVLARTRSIVQPA